MIIQQILLVSPLRKGMESRMDNMHTGVRVERVNITGIFFFTDFFWMRLAQTIVKQLFFVSGLNAIKV